jgi:peptidoglycan hydrolase FlgJ
LLKRQLGSQPASASKAASSHGPLPLAHTPAEFVHRVLPTISRAARALGVDPKGLLAQAALETGWGQRMPRTADGSLSLNIFGVKAGDEWSGARATSDSVEFSNGVATPRRSTFRAYGSIEESVADFAKLLKNSPRYRDAIAAGADPVAYVQSIGKSGYATDPEYGNKLNQILKGDTLQAALGVRTAAL